MMHRAYIALGANLGNPQATLQTTLAALAQLPQSRLTQTSSFYRTAPISETAQPDFINAVAAIHTSLDADTLLSHLLNIEQHFGRTRSSKNAPRTLDLDLLLYDEQIQHKPHLHLPHPRMHLRAFVLVPLAEIAPDCTIPGRGHIADWLPTVSTQSIERLPLNSKPIPTPQT